MDYYETLGVPKDAKPEQIKEAFRRLAQKYHPDKPGGDAAKFKEINEAYQVLSDAQKRAQYDQYGSAFTEAQQKGGFSGFEGFRDWINWAEAMKEEQSRQKEEESSFNDFFDLGDIFSDFFSFGSSRGARQRSAQTNRDIILPLTLEFEEAALGTEKEISFSRFEPCSECQASGLAKGSKMKTCSYCQGQGQIRQNRSTIFGTFSQVSTCPECQGTGQMPEKKCPKCQGEGRIKNISHTKVKIPAGVNDGGVIKFAGQGHFADNKKGTLYLRIKVKPHPIFQREGDDIYLTQEIPLTTAVLGGKIEVPTLEGKVFLKVPEGTNFGQEFILRGKGVPHLKGRGRGNEIVRLTIKIPKHLTKKQKQLFENLNL